MDDDTETQPFRMALEETSPGVYTAHIAVENIKTKETAKAFLAATGDWITEEGGWMTRIH